MHRGQAQCPRIQGGKTKFLPHRARSQRQPHLYLNRGSSPGCTWSCSRRKEPSRKAWLLRPEDWEAYKIRDYERDFKPNAVRTYILLKILVCLNLFICSLIMGFYLPSSLSKSPLTSPLSPPHHHLQFLALPYYSHTSFFSTPNIFQTLSLFLPRDFA